ncbi:methionine--tRNA ligase [Patescibacteria group bacterium]|nr:methionine--tRNA ligase [Patescibacteria group bacterium]
MQEKIKKIYIGVAWPYVNDIFHIGNLIGAYLPADIFSRFHKLKGNKVLMISGSDFHGTPITIKAEEQGKKPEEIAQKFHKLNKEYLKKFGIEYTFYTSTHTKNHQQIVQKIFLKLLKKGFIRALKTEQLYSEKAKKFLQDRYIEGECPYCGDKSARGDQCEKCGRVLEAVELLNPVSKLDKSKLVKKTTENYFLDFSLLQGKIKKWLISQKWERKWIKKEAMGWIKEGLHPRPITRDMDYGARLPVFAIPETQRIENIKNKVFYVWFEAVIGYLSGAIEYAKKINKPNFWKEFFYDAKAKTYYFVGQDNLVFHTINWPGQLIAFDEKINLPVNVFVNKFLLLEGRKMSKSRGWFIETPYLIKNYSTESLRFYLAFNMPEKKEFNFTWQDFIQTNNKVLVGTIGNFIHRVLIFASQNFGREYQFSMDILSPEIKSQLQKTFRETAVCLEKGEFRSALEKNVQLASFGNQYLDKHQVWRLIKKEPLKAKKIILNALAIIDALRILFYPFLPKSMEKLNEFLGYKKRFVFKEAMSQWVFPKHLKNVKLSLKIAPLFSKIDEKKIKEEMSKLKTQNSNVKTKT